MIKIFKLALVVFAMVLFVGCVGKNNQAYLPKSGGSPHEVIVVATQAAWKGEIGDSIKKILQQPVEMINFDEPEFNLVNIKPNNFAGLYSKHRNILMVNIDPKFTESNLYWTVDKYSKPQAIAVIQAPNQESVIELLKYNGDKIFERFKEEEQVRFVARLNQYNAEKISDIIREKFGLEVKIPRGYKLMKVASDEIIWTSYDMPIATQNVVMYEYPYDGKALNVSSIVENRDRFMGHIPSQLPNTMMKTSDAFEPDVKLKRFNGRDWYEARGFWNVKNDFMGGPFVSYSTVDTARNRVIVLETFVYAPDHTRGQRNYVRQLESLVRTVKIAN